MKKISISKQLGEQLKHQREEKKLTQEELAGITGLSKYSISKIESGQWNFTVDKLYEYCNAIDLELRVTEFDPVEVNLILRNKNEVENTIFPRFVVYFNDEGEYLRISWIDKPTPEILNKIPAMLRKVGDFYALERN